MRTAVGCPAGRHCRAPLANGPTNSFFFVSTLTTGSAWSARHAARDQLVHAAGVIADTTIDLVGTIGRLVLDNLLTPRRPPTSARTVKRAISEYNARGPNIDRRTYQSTTTIAILTGPA